ncbi:putative membrane protein [Desulfitobacterium dehalogenans ATCC 51507]|uniref:Putative membrane protein n=1 Tax=Desulfitobacterium dehalogenans (strain ATCC 51507 / DSM 9161 / JW/IU-DC1) TaxID=756499 RepID=I4A791_DESDJ|nr:Gx transporter family protein [Desulfitobacterium dehalogenans]AFL99825.1 putative membrane protein [Desulfitobacterium dehalogenans ATCC 51507]
MNRSKRFAIIIILVTNAIIISFLESFIPVPIPVPGIKLGLGNIITMIAIVFLGFKDVLFIVLVRCFVVAILTRGVMMLAFSLTGGILSALVMWLLYRKLSRFFSIKGISIAGAIVHNTTQITIASFILGQAVVFYYLPILLISAVVTGLVTGSIGELAINEINKKEIFKKDPEPHESAEEQVALKPGDDRELIHTGTNDNKEVQDSGVEGN